MKLIGHKDNWEKIVNLHKSVPPFWIFYGEKGIGKATFAKYLAAYVLDDGQNLDETFFKITKGAHQNFRYINSAGKEIRLETLAVIRDFLEHKCVGRKILIVDNADQLNRFVANGILKLVEQDYQDTLIIFIVHNLYSLPTTIRSRFCKLSFSPLEQKEFPESYTEIFPYAQGSLGMAMWIEEKGGMDFVEKVKYLVYLKTFSKDHEMFIEDEKDGNHEFILQLIKNILYLDALESNVDFSLLYQRLSRFIMEAENAHLNVEDYLTTVFVLLQNPVGKIFSIN